MCARERSAGKKGCREPAFKNRNAYNKWSRGPTQPASGRSAPRSVTAGTGPRLASSPGGSWHLFRGDSILLLQLQRDASIGSTWPRPKRCDGAKASERQSLLGGSSVARRAAKKEAGIERDSWLAASRQASGCENRIYLIASEAGPDTWCRLILSGRAGLRDANPPIGCSSAQRPRGPAGNASLTHRQSFPRVLDSSALCR